MSTFRSNRDSCYLIYGKFIENYLWNTLDDLMNALDPAVLEFSKKPNDPGAQERVSELAKGINNLASFEKPSNTKTVQID